jgi:redox-sensitive bicupin YhaK (pirin superfamily)
MEEIIVLAPEDHAVLGPDEFGQDGLIALESIGPFARIRVCGPLITVHDSVIEAGKPMGHHRHRHNERLLYVERGTLDHEDARNGIKVHVPQGAMAEFIEGRRGMAHSEWNHGDVDAEIYILATATRPIPAETIFEVLEQEDMPVYDEADGVFTREMVGAKAPLPVFSDIRTFTDTTMSAGAELHWAIPADDGGVMSVRQGAVQVAGRELVRKSTLVVPPASGERLVAIAVDGDARIIRTTFASGFGLIVADGPGAADTAGRFWSAGE